MDEEFKIASSAIQLKRAYEAPEVQDGVRVLVDRLWPRGISKPVANLDAWMKELGPTHALRTWFGHQPARWEAFEEQYRRELATPLRQLLLAEIHGVAAGSTLTLVYGAHDSEQNEAVVLRDYLLQEWAPANTSWDLATQILVTAAAVAGAHPDAIVTQPGLALFASAILTSVELEAALQNLLTEGTLREASAGWQITARGQHQLRTLSEAGSAR